MLETSGIGQADTEVVEYCDIPVYIMTPEYGAATQLEKIEMLDFADLVVVNKSDKPGALDAMRDVRKQYQRNQKLFQTDLEDMPVFRSVASDFNDPGVEEMYLQLLDLIGEKSGSPLKLVKDRRKHFYTRVDIIPGKRMHYLSEISEQIGNINRWIEEQVGIANNLFGLQRSIDILQENQTEGAVVSGSEAQSVKTISELKKVEIEKVNLRQR
jgi:methylmalonyl-CoA mutase